MSRQRPSRRALVLRSRRRRRLEGAVGRPLLRMRRYFRWHPTKSPHPEEAAKRPSRRTHIVDPVSRARRALSLRQALGFDIEYTARQSEEERARLEQVLANDAAGLADKTETFRRLIDLSNRYATEIARDQARLAEAARHEADRLALPYRQAFDEIGAGWRNAVKGLIEGTQSFGCDRDPALG